MNTLILDNVYKLAQAREPIPFSSIPKPLFQDFLSFMTGRAFIKRGNDYSVLPADFREWLNKLTERGLDSELDIS